MKARMNGKAMLTAKQKTLPKALQQKIIKGVNVLADNVASTLGPRGRNVLLQEKEKIHSSRKMA